MIEHVITNFIGRVNELTFRLNLYVLIFTDEAVLHNCYATQAPVSCVPVETLTKRRNRKLVFVSTRYFAANCPICF